jgi:MoaA/NifB/PqqE/SkfB family radical SAM enzyme
MTYGFYGRLQADFPSQVIVEATELCNLACIHCPHATFEQSEHYAGRHLDPAINERLVDEVREHGRGKTQYIRYTSNGEPLIHPRIYDLLDYAVQSSGTFVTLTTNGTILNEKRIEKVLASGLHMIDVSIDAMTPDVYAKIRVNGHLETTNENVMKLLRAKARARAKTKIAVSFVEQQANRHQAEEFERFWRAQGVDFVIVRRLHSSAGGVIEVAELMRHLPAVARRACLYPWERIVITPGGHIAFCPQDWVHGSMLGHYSETTIRDVWNGEFYRGLREAHLANDYSGHAFCDQCPDWRQTRWPGEGSSYADVVEACLQQT